MHSFSKFFLFLPLLYGFFVSTAQTQPGRSLNVDEAVRQGLNHNATLRVARAKADEARAAYRQARAGRLPALRSQASYMRLSDNIPEISFSTDFLPGLDTTYTLAPVELNQYYAEIAVEQPLFTGFRLHNRIKSARHQADAVAYETAQEEADVAFRIREAYWRLYEALAVRDATDKALAQVEAHLNDVRNRREAGSALASDVLTVQTRRSEVRLERVEAVNAVRVANLELNRLTGLPLQTEIQPEVELTVETLPEDTQVLVERALKERPSIQAIDAQIQALKSEIGATRGDWWPQIALTGRYIYARPNQYFFTEQDKFKATWEAGIGLRWNIWDGGAKLAATRQAQARFEAAEARLTATREAVTVQVTRQYLEVQRASEAIAVAGQNVEEAQEALRMMQQQYTEGVALSSQVLEAEQALRNAQARRAQAQADYAIARGALLNALGKVWE